MSLSQIQQMQVNKQVDMMPVLDMIPNEMKDTKYFMAFLAKELGVEEKDILDFELSVYLMEEPASFYFSVMWNKLYRRDLIMQHNIRCSEEFSWSEDLLFNLEYIRYAERFCSMRTPVYYYSRGTKHSLVKSVTPKQAIATRTALLAYYKQLYIDLGLYERYKLQILRYLVATAKDL